MKRNIIGCAESGKKKQYKHGERFMLTLSEARELIGIISKEENYMDGLYAAVACAYDAGFECGSRYEKRNIRQTLKKGVKS